MVVIDSSVWIGYFRGQDQGLIKDVYALLEEDEVLLPTPVWIEILSGAHPKELKQLKTVLSALPRITPSKSTWKTIDSWLPIAIKKGKKFGLGDYLIAALAAEHAARLWSLDADFDQMAQLKFVKLF